MESLRILASFLVWKVFKELPGQSKLLVNIGKGLKFLINGTFFVKIVVTDKIHALEQALELLLYSCFLTLFFHALFILTCVKKIGDAEP